MTADLEPQSPLVRFFRRIFVPLALLIFAPPFVMLLRYAIVELDGSLMALFQALIAEGPHEVVWAAWGPYIFGSQIAWTIIGIFALSQLVFMRVLPGAEFCGPPTPKGHIPVYKANGFLAFGVTILAFLGGSFGLHLFEASILYDHFAELLGALNVFSVVFCIGLYLKGRFAPSGPDSGTTGNIAFDYFQGTELYPRILGWDVKTFTNCRFGMMGWPLLIISFAARQHEVHGLSDSMMVALALQLIYIAKFFYWETGYWRSLDIMHDRAGFYICWGCLVWLPSVYTCHTLYLADHPNELGWPLATVVFVVGVAAILINYLADHQRQHVRATGGKTKVWGREPELIHARYTTSDGEERESLLLTNGWWGISRHFHYVPEWTAAVCWSFPALFAVFLPWFYVFFLTILLTDRAFRDDRRCAKKYGEHWEEYSRRVPYKIIPGLL